jgi:hypothetical protein
MGLVSRQRHAEDVEHMQCRKFTTQNSFRSHNELSLDVFFNQHAEAVQPSDGVVCSTDKKRGERNPRGTGNQLMRLRDRVGDGHEARCTDKQAADHPTSKTQGDACLSKWSCNTNGLRTGRQEAIATAIINIKIHPIGTWVQIQFFLILMDSHDHGGSINKCCSWQEKSGWKPTKKLRSSLSA